MKSQRSQPVPKATRQINERDRERKRDREREKGRQLKTVACFGARCGHSFKWQRLCNNILVAFYAFLSLHRLRINEIINK